MHNYSDPPPAAYTASAPRRSNAIWWLLGGIVALGVLVCGGILASIVYLGAVGPDTSVYTGNRVPARFLRTMEDVGALDEEEKIVYFYSDAMTDIRDGFYFISDRKVVIYSQATGESPLTVIPFDQIADAELVRNESFFVDSEITLTLEDGQILSFPVSSEYGRDQQFFDAIQERMAKRPANPQ